MGKFYSEIPGFLVAWIQKQHMFWVASAPLNAHGHVNVSPKGIADCFHVVNPKQVWYEDLTGSGIETISHIRENGRITIMFCAFEGPPQIVRLFGVGTVHEYGTSEYSALNPPETRKPGSRAAIFIDIYKVSMSCGFAVPLYDFVTHRTKLLMYWDKREINDRLLITSNGQEQPKKQHATLCDPTENKKSSNGRRETLRDFWLGFNLRSLDGLPGLATAPDTILTMGPQSRFDENARPVLRQQKETSNNSRRFVFGDRTSFASGFVFGVVTMLLLAYVFGKLRFIQIVHEVATNIMHHV